ncbi:MAG TPA: hypothetical protein VIK91_09835, partial [Nannocystis sp.]
MHTASLSPVLRSAISRHKPLSPDEERATASAIWLAREDAWRLVLDDPTARSRAVAVLEATGRADVPEARVDAKDCRALLDALSTGDPLRIAVADKDDVVLRLAAGAIAPHLRASIRSCLVRLDAAVARLERHNVALVVHVARRCYSIALGDATRKANRKGEPPMRLAGVIELDDLVAWGMIHLRTAALRFDSRRG